VEELAIAPCGHIADASSFTEMLRAVVAADRERLSSLAVAVCVLADQAEAEATPTWSNSSRRNTRPLKAARTTRSRATLLPSLPIWTFGMKCWTAKMTQAKSSDGDEPMEDGGEMTMDVFAADDTNLFPVLPVRKLGLQFLNMADYLQLRVASSRGGTRYRWRP